VIYNSGQLVLGRAGIGRIVVIRLLNLDLDLDFIGPPKNVGAGCIYITTRPY
jgi:hypothetical protein